MERRRTGSCQWCGREFGDLSRGRPRKYCSQSCRQRAYEQRHAVVGTTIPQDAVIMTKDRAQDLTDGLFQLRCAAEDIATASREGATSKEIEDLCSELIALARQLEKIR